MTCLCVRGQGYPVYCRWRLGIPCFRASLVSGLASAAWSAGSALDLVVRRMRRGLWSFDFVMGAPGVAHVDEYVSLRAPCGATGH